MLRDKSWLAVIPARGGSKGLKNKNIQMLNGKPLICWAIDAAKDSGIFDRIVVSTDSPVIADVALKENVLIHDRPAELATDTAEVMDVMQHVCESQNRSFHYVQLLEPTSPLITGIDILKAARYLQESDASFLISVCESDVPLGVAKPIPESGRLTNWFPRELRGKNRQQIDSVWQLDGNIYMGKWHIFAKNMDYWDVDIRAWKMPKSKFCHIDDEQDLHWAEVQMGLLNRERQKRSLWRFVEKLYSGRATH